MIRVLSATCSFVCENGGHCVGADKCKCKPGWDGVDCTIPICTNHCLDRQLCVAPNECGCIPGYKGEYCNQPTCVQDCIHGVCSAPDTCKCDTGWFDSNCTTPVCKQTCGNGGKSFLHMEFNCVDAFQCLTHLATRRKLHWTQHMHVSN